jgi:hypothetical protein
MNIGQMYDVFKKQIEVEKTPSGRPLTKEAILNLDAALSDEKNYKNEAVNCVCCGMVQSILLVENGCANCGCLDIDANIDT